MIPKLYEKNGTLLDVRSLIDDSLVNMERATKNCDCPELLRNTHIQTMAQLKFGILLNDNKYKAFFTPRENDIMRRDYVNTAKQQSTLLLSSITYSLRLYPAFEKTGISLTNYLRKQQNQISLKRRRLIIFYGASPPQKVVRRD